MRTAFVMPLPAPLSLPRICAAGAAGVALIVLATASLASENDKLSQFGYAGALQTPTAVMPEKGVLGFGISRTQPYGTLYLSMQPLEWLNITARYASISGRTYGDGSDQSLKDKAFDGVIRLWREGEWWPAASVGLIDAGGTGLFSSEFVAFSRSFQDFYATAGIGWGRLGSAGDFRNPLLSLSDSFEDRSGDRGRGGKFNVGEWFGGEQAAVFGSLIWSPRHLPVAVTLEYEGNDYSDEPTPILGRSASRLNAAVAYHFGPAAFAEISYLRGDTIGFQLGIAPQVGTADPPVGPMFPELDSNTLQTYRAARDPQARNLAAIYDQLVQRGVYPYSMELDEETGTFTVWQASTVPGSAVELMQLIGVIVFNNLPESFEHLRIVQISGGIEALSMTAPRWAIEAVASDRMTIDALTHVGRFESARPGTAARAEYRDLVKLPTYMYGVDPLLRSNIGGVAGFYLGELALKPFLVTQLTRRWSITGAIGISVVSELDRVREASGARSGTLPRVRSELERYQRESRGVFLAQLETNYFFPVATDLFGRVSAGIFEPMYGGVAGELLYRPVGKRWSVVLDANYVRKRDYEQRFDFLDYEVATGHLGVHYETPFDGVRLFTSVGRYLAKDVGMTIEISKGFRNGARFGAFASFTDASAEEFGEGSFDKGFYLNIPLSAFSPRFKTGSTQLDYRFLWRDGGQKVDDGRQLYDVFGEFTQGWAYEH